MNKIKKKIRDTKRNQKIQTIRDTKRNKKIQTKICPTRGWS